MKLVAIARIETREIDGAYHGAIAAIKAKTSSTPQPSAG